MAQTAREASLARRKALSSTGKAAITGKTDRTRTASAATATASAPAASAPAVASYTPAPAPVVAKQGGTARQASLARRIAMSKGGKKAVASTDRVRSGANRTSAPASAPAASERKEGCDCGCGSCGGKNKSAASTADMSLSTVVTPQVSVSVPNKIAMSPAKAASLSRRKAMSAKGKAALKGGTVSEASAARAANPNISSRELAQTLRQQRSSKGKTDRKKTTAVATGPGRHRKPQEPAEDQPWKVGVTETASGQAVTGTMVDRVPEVTGNEASTCRTVTGTEYMGADVFKDYCQSEVKAGFNRVSVTTTGSGSRVSGINVARSAKVTGNEPGTCKAVTGTEYVSSEQAQAFCAAKGPTKPAKITLSETAKGKTVTGDNVGRSSKVTGDEPGSNRQLTGSQYMQAGDGNAPAKVGVSKTLRGGSVSGTQVGRSTKVTGDEPGSCRAVTGDDYVGSEQYSDFCQSAPAPSDQKVGVSATLMGKTVTGTMTDRGGNVTGNEAGTCKAVTGTPYAGAGQAEAFCSSPEKSVAMARARKGTSNVGPSMTGIQPGISDVMTGAGKGACEPVTGTPYVGADQAATACPATAATPVSPDFPQPIAGQPWGEFSVTPPSGGAYQGGQMSGVTGSRYEQGNITGPFGMAGGKVTGTEEARFGGSKTPMPEPTVEPVGMVEGRVKSRITGEGMDAGQKITGDDWERGDRVTGTEGTSATRRNPTLRGPMAAMAVANKRNEEVPMPVSKVTGSSGSTEQGSLITYSGGARG